MNRLFAFWLMSAVAILSPAAELEWYRIGKVVSYEKMTGTDPVVDVAVDMFCSDMQAVTGQQPQKASHATIQLVQLDAAKTSLKKKLRKMGIPVDSLSQMDAFWLGVKKRKDLGYRTEWTRNSLCPFGTIPKGRCFSLDMVGRPSPHASRQADPR